MKDSDNFGFAAIGFGVAGYLWETAEIGLVFSIIGLVAGISSYSESKGSGLAITDCAISIIAIILKLRLFII